jgi:hypothetical protein
LQRPFGAFCQCAIKAMNATYWPLEHMENPKPSDLHEGMWFLSLIKSKKIDWLFSLKKNA